MEYVPISFFNVIVGIGKKSEDVGRFFINQIADAINHMHAMNIVHRDLKPENIMVDENLNVKIADFGLATSHKIDSLGDSQGTKIYMAPELIEQRIYNGKKVDMFAIGVILFFLVTGIFPFAAADKNDRYYRNLTEGHFEQYQGLVRGLNLSESFKDLVKKLLSYDPSDRPNIYEMLAHPWMQTQYDVETTKATIHNQIQGILTSSRPSRPSMSYRFK